METEQYKYDVAFSFLAQDEALATQLNDLLQDRVKTFLYSNEQETIAGTDGERTFIEVFGKQARLVVVLYRKKWEESPWTRIEKTAIRNRGYEEGYDFAKFIPLEDPPTVPNWFPKSQIWIGLKRGGVEGAAAVIEARIKELGGNPHEENVQERAARHERSLMWKHKRSAFLNSSEGADAANKEFEGLRGELQTQIGLNKKAARPLDLQLRARPRRIEVTGLSYALVLRWKLLPGNELKDSQLEVELWMPDGGGPTNKLKSLFFTVDLVPPEQIRWISTSREKRAYTTPELAEFVLKFYMNEDSGKAEQ